MDKANGKPNRVRFHALTQILGVSANTLYLWRKGALTSAPALPIEVDQTGTKPKVWVDLAELEGWLAKHRSGHQLLKRLRSYERHADKIVA
jgi:hypothetical protein